MLGILNNLKVILGTVVAVVLFGVGYSFGAHRVDSLKEQIKKLENEANDAKAQLKKTQDEVATTLAAQAAEYAKQAQQLKIEAAQQKKRMDAALSEANNRIKSL